MFLFAFLAAAAGSWLGGILHDGYGGYQIAFDGAAALVALGLAPGFAHLRGLLKEAGRRDQVRTDEAKA